MQIRVSKNSVAGDQQIPSGDYLVALHTEAQQIRLTGKGLDIVLPAIKRRMKAKTKIESVQFFSGGGASWSIVIQSPKYGEWVAMIEVKSG